MKLIEPLCNGFADAPSGTATIYLAGTTTPATVYTGPDATGSTTGTAGVHDLSALGRKKLYTNARVDVTVKTAAGATVETFTVGDHAGVVRSQSPAFTLTSGFVDLETAFGRAFTSFGDEDWLVGGRYIKDVLGPNKRIFDVTTYGAVGNGVADDTVAVQAAVSAADAVSNGEVFFPPGTYRITSGLTGTTASLIGVPGTSKITVSASFAGDMYARTTAGTYVYGLEFELQNSASTGNCIRTTSPSNVLVERCIFRPASGTGVYVASTAAGRVRINSCDFYLAQASARAVRSGGLNSFEFFVQDAYVAITAGLTRPAFDGYVAVSGGSFVLTSASNANMCAGGSMGAAVLQASGGGLLGMGDGVTYSFTESGNTLLSSACTSTATGTIVSHYSSSTQRVTTSSNVAAAGTYNPDTRQHGTFTLSLAGNATIANPNAIWDGAVIDIYLRNTSGGISSITWGANFRGTPTASIPVGQGVRARFVGVSATGLWIGYGALTPFAN